MATENEGYDPHEVLRQAREVHIQVRGLRSSGRSVVDLRQLAGARGSLTAGGVGVGENPSLASATRLKAALFANEIPTDEEQAPE